MSIGTVTVDFVVNTAKFQDGLRKTTATLGNLGKDWRKLGGDLTKFVTLPLTGIAVAATRAADPTGAFAKELKSVGDAASQALRPLGDGIIKAFHALEPAIRGAIDAITAVTDVFASLPDAVQVGIVALGGMLAIAGPVTFAVGGIATAVNGLTTSLVGLNAAAGGGALAKIAKAVGPVAAGAAAGFGLDALLSQPTYYRADGTPVGSGWQVLFGGAPEGRPDLSGLGQAAGGLGSMGLDMAIDNARRAKEHLQRFDNARELRESVRPLEILEERIDQLNRLAKEFPGLLTPGVVADVASKLTEELDPAVREAERVKQRVEAITAEAFPDRRIASEMAELARLRDSGAIGFDVFTERSKQLQKELDGLKTKLGETFGDQLVKKIESFGSSAADAFTDFVFEGKAALDDLVESWGRALVQMAAQAAIFQPLADAFGKGLGGLFGATGGGTSKKPTSGGGVQTVHAHGNAFGPGGVIPFARGGVVRRPTLFPFARGIGLMGEAGPEAILPLRRIGKDLGVMSSGGGVTVQVIDQRGAGAPVEVEQSTGADGRQRIRILVRDAVRELIGNGQLDRMMGRTYGVRRRGIS